MECPTGVRPYNGGARAVPAYPKNGEIFGLVEERSIKNPEGARVLI